METFEDENCFVGVQHINVLLGTCKHFSMEFVLWEYSMKFVSWDYSMKFVSWEYSMKLILWEYS